MEAAFAPEADAIELRRDMHQFGDGLGLHPLHDAGAVKFHRLLDHTHICRDLLVELACSHCRQNLSLTRVRLSKRCLNVGLTALA